MGVNLIHSAFNLAHRPENLLESLLDNLSRDRIEIDMVEFKGIEYEFNRKFCNHFIQLSVKELENKSGFWEVGLF